MVVHVTLQENLLRDSKELASVVEKIQRETGLRVQNERRLARYGILTGEIEPDQLERLRGVEGVEHVASDERRYVSCTA